MPRTSGTVWNHFLLISERNFKKHVTCNYCDTHYKYAMGNRLKRHLMRCEECPADVKQSLYPNIKHDSEYTVLAAKASAPPALARTPTAEPRLLKEETTRANRKISTETESDGSADITNPEVDNCIVGSRDIVDESLDTSTETVNTPQPTRKRSHEESTPNVRDASTNTQLPYENEFDIFGKSVAAQLKALPLEKALQAQHFIQTYITGLRLQQCHSLSSLDVAYPHSSHTVYVSSPLPPS